MSSRERIRKLSSFSDNPACSLPDPAEHPTMNERHHEWSPMKDQCWTPTAAARAASRMESFRLAFAARLGRELDDYQAFHRASVEDSEAFWSLIWQELGIVGDQGPRVLDHPDRMPGARWFPEARLNFAENLLQHSGEGAAVIFRGEDGRRTEWSFDELKEKVLRLKGALRELGLTPGDRVAAFMPNLPETLALMLAATSLGACWSSASPDFGVDGVLDRFGQLDPTLLVAADGYLYKGRAIDCREKLAEIRRGLPGLRKTVLVSILGEEQAEPLDPGMITFEKMLKKEPDHSPFERFPFDHPLYIMFSSGTTGKPKCITHGAGGTLLQHRKEHALHSGLGPGDRLFYFTTTGWMMWNWLVSALAGGSTVVLFDGNPFHPSPRALWDLADAERVTHFGTSAKYIDACAKAGLRPMESHWLEALRVLLSTGSVLVPESFDYVYHSIKQDLQLASISGGTDIISCFALGNPALPVVRGQLQCRGLGMDVKVVSETGEELVGEPGELVCARPFPSMPTGFYGDADGSRYRAAYFEKFPGIWHHGDWVQLEPEGGMTFFGRSDATLNPGGVRIGTAEIYRQVEQVAEVEESVVIGQDLAGDQRILLFVRLKQGLELDQGLRDTIRQAIRQNTTPRHVPARILQVTDIPRTRSGKISELAVKRVVQGQDPGNLEALANPEALAEFANRQELKEGSRE